MTASAGPVELAATPIMTLQAYLFFLPACLALNLSFGPNNLLSVTSVSYTHLTLPTNREV